MVRSSFDVYFLHLGLYQNFILFTNLITLIGSLLFCRLSSVGMVAATSMAVAMSSSSAALTVENAAPRYFTYVFLIRVFGFFFVFNLSWRIFYLPFLYFEFQRISQSRGFLWEILWSKLLSGMSRKPASMTVIFISFINCIQTFSFYYLFLDLLFGDWLVNDM